MRVLPLLGATVALGLAGLNFANLLGWAYAQLAESQLDNPATERVLVSARHAAALAPWSATRTGVVGWIHAERGNAEEAEAAYRRALRWAPAEPLLWTEYALALARIGRFDGLELAVSRAMHLAPASPAVQGALASMGLSYWELGSAELRKLWLRAMRYELEHNRRQFLSTAVTRGRVRALCTGAGKELDLSAWCDGVREAATKCRDHDPGGEDFLLCMRRR